MKSMEILNEMKEDKKVAGPAGEEELQYLTNACRIPGSYVEFLSVYNGAKLFEQDGIAGLQLLSGREVLHYTQYAQNTFEEEWDDKIIIFAKMIGEDNYLGFKILNEDNGDYVVLDCYFEESPKEWRVIADSFDEFLSEYLLSNGKKFWIDR